MFSSTRWSFFKFSSKIIFRNNFIGRVEITVKNLLFLEIINHNWYTFKGHICDTVRNTAVIYEITLLLYCTFTECFQHAQQFGIIVTTAKENLYYS